MNCDDARAAFLAGDATKGEMDHIGSCPECRRDWSAIDDARRVLDDPAFWSAPPDDLEDRLVAMIAGAADGVEPAGSIRRKGWQYALGGGAIAAVLVAALWVGNREPAADWEVALPATAEAPGAVGVVSGWNEAGGTRVALDIEGLPTAPDGYVYEFWFTNGPIHISAGTFKAPENVELWVGVTRADFPRLWITLEPIDDDESPSGVNVMDTA